MDEYVEEEYIEENCLDDCSALLLVILLGFCVLVAYYSALCMSAEGGI